MPSTRSFRAGVALVLVAASLVAPVHQALGAGTGSDPPADPRALDKERVKLQQRYAEVDAQMAALLTTYDASRAAQAALDAQVADLDGRITVAANDLQGAQAVLADADARVATGEQHVAAARVRLGVAVENLRSQALASYTGEGPLALVASAVERADVELVIAMSYAHLFADIQQRHLDAFTVQHEVLNAEQRTLDAARADADARRTQIVAAKSDLERQRTEQAALQEQAAQKVAEQEQLVQQLKARKASYQNQIDDLARESAAIKELLRQRAMAATTTTTAKPKATTTTAKPKATTTAKPGTPTTKPVPTTKPATTTSVKPAPTPTIAPPAGAPSFAFPLPGFPVVSGFGMRTQPVTGIYQLHAGIDIWAPEGTPIHAAAAGTVVSVGVHHGYGNAVIIDHGGGWATVYAHQSQTAASVGQHVNKGDVIGFVGHTGLAAGPHLHFEIRVNGDPVDPLRYVHP